MVDAVFIAPVGGVTIGADGFKDYLFFGLAEGDGEENLIAFGDVQVFTQTVFLNGSEHTATEPLIYRTEENTLGGNAVVDEEVLAYFCVPEDNDIGGGALSCGGARPVGKGGSPPEVLEYGGVLLGFTGKDVFERLKVGAGCRTPCQVNEFPEGVKVNGNVLVKAAVTPVFKY